MDDQEYDVDHLWDSNDNNLTAAIRGKLRGRAADGWELVNTAPYFAYDVFSIILFWRRTVS
jgi:hypothetical protein